MNQDTIVELADIRFRWPKDQHDTLAIKKFSVHENEHVFIRGDSGAGKTTLLNLLCGIHIANSGSINILGTQIESLSTHARDQFRGECLGVIFQQFNLLPFLTVKENIVIASGFSQTRSLKVSDSEQETRRLLDALDLPESILNKNITELSVGQQQRVAACRALYGAPPIIIADEPTSALDRKNRDLFLQLLFKEANNHGSTIVFVSHDEYTAKHFTKVEELSEHNLAQRP